MHVDGERPAGSSEGHRLDGDHPRGPDQVRKLFMRRLEVFPPQGTSIRDTFFARQSPAGEKHPGRRHLGICAFGRRFPAAMIRVYTALMASGNGVRSGNFTFPVRDITGRRFGTRLEG